MSDAEIEDTDANRFTEALNLPGLSWRVMLGGGSWLEAESEHLWQAISGWLDDGAPALPVTLVAGRMDLHADIARHGAGAKRGAQSSISVLFEDGTGLVWFEPEVEPDEVTTPPVLVVVPTETGPLGPLEIEELNLLQEDLWSLANQIEGDDKEQALRRTSETLGAQLRGNAPPNRVIVRLAIADAADALGPELSEAFSQYAAVLDVIGATGIAEDLRGVGRALDEAEVTEDGAEVHAASKELTEATRAAVDAAVEAGAVDRPLQPKPRGTLLEEVRSGVSNGFGQGVGQAVGVAAATGVGVALLKFGPEVPAMLWRFVQLYLNLYGI